MTRTTCLVSAYTPFLIWVVESVLAYWAAHSELWPFTIVLLPLSIFLLAVALEHRRDVLTRYASRIEARSDATGTGAAAGESLVGVSRDAPNTPQVSDNEL